MQTVEIDVDKYRADLQDKIQRQWGGFLRRKGDANPHRSPTVAMVVNYSDGRMELIAKIFFHRQGNIAVVSEYIVVGKDEPTRVKHMSEDEIVDLFEMVWGWFEQWV